MNTRIRTALFLFAVFCSTVAPGVDFDKVRKERATRWEEARAKNDAASYVEHVKWCDEHEKLIEEKDPIYGVLKVQLRINRQHALTSALKTVGPNDRGAIMWLAGNLEGFQAYELFLRMCEYIATHPDDDEMCALALKGKEGRDRCPVYRAKSDGYFARIAGRNSAEEYSKLGRWHRAIPAKYVDVSEFYGRTLYCCLKALRLEPENPVYRKDYEDIFAKVLEYALKMKADDGEGRDDIACELKPKPPVPVSACGLEENRIREGREYKIIAGGETRYQTLAPATNSAAEEVWKYCDGRAAGYGVFSGDNVESTPGADAENACGFWVRLDWDSELCVWSEYPLPKERERLEENVRTLKQSVERHRLAINEWQDRILFSRLMPGTGLGSENSVGRVACEAARRTLYHSSAMEEIAAMIKDQESQLAALGGYSQSARHSAAVLWFLLVFFSATVAGAAFAVAAMRKAVRRRDASRRRRAGKKT